MFEIHRALKKLKRGNSKNQKPVNGISSNNINFFFLNPVPVLIFV